MPLLPGFDRAYPALIEDLEATPALRAGFQFWTLRYASGDSIPDSAHVLRQSLRRARRVLDPDGTDAAFDRMVVVGHSLGGILAKMMVQSGGPRLWQTVCARPIDQVIGPTEECQLLRQAGFTDVRNLRGGLANWVACGLPLERTSPADAEERRVVTAVFVDLVGSTARAEGADPEDVRARLVPYHDSVRREELDRLLR